MPGVTVSPPWTQLMPALFCSPVRPGESRRFKKLWNHRGHIPVNAGSTRCIPIQCGACRRRYGVVSVDPGVHTVATPGLKSGTVWTSLNLILWSLFHRQLMTNVEGFHKSLPNTLVVPWFPLYNVHESYVLPCKSKSMLLSCVHLLYISTHVLLSAFYKKNAIKGKLSDSFTNYNYVGNTKVSVSIKKT